MMIARVFSAALVLTLVVVGCEQSEPTAVPMDEIASPNLSATSEWQDVELLIDFTWFAECANAGAGEIVHFYGPVEGRVHTVNTPSGRTKVNAMFTTLPGYSITGLTTGDVYYPRPGVRAHWSEAAGGPGSTVYSYYERIVVTNEETGVTLEFPYWVKITLNPNGVETVFRAVEGCKARG